MNNNNFDFEFKKWLQVRCRDENKKINDRIHKFRNKQDFFVMRERGYLVLRDHQFICIDESSPISNNIDKFKTILKESIIKQR